MNQKHSTIHAVAWTVVRVAFGAMMLTHGIPKLGRLFGDEPIRFVNILGLGTEVSLALAVFSEVVCAVFLIVGYRTRWATLPLIVTMLVAALYAHWDDPFKEKEMALLYLFGYLALWVSGSGPYSVDGLMEKKEA